MENQFNPQGQPANEPQHQDNNRTDNEHSIIDVYSSHIEKPEPKSESEPKPRPTIYGPFWPPTH